MEGVTVIATSGERPWKPIGGLSEEQFTEAIVMYDKKIADEIYDEVNTEFGIDFTDEKLGQGVKKLLDAIIEKAITAGSIMAKDIYLVTSYYKEQKNIENDDRCGVEDKSTGKFYPCPFGCHWAQIQAIMNETYSDMGEALYQLAYGNKHLDECNGYTRENIDDFIMSNFRLIGETTDLESHIEAYVR